MTPLLLALALTGQAAPAPSPVDTYQPFELCGHWTAGGTYVWDKHKFRRHTCPTVPAGPYIFGVEPSKRAPIPGQVDGNDSDLQRELARAMLHEHQQGPCPGPGPCPPREPDRKPRPEPAPHRPHLIPDVDGDAARLQRTITIGAYLLTGGMLVLSFTLVFVVSLVLIFRRK